MILPIRRIAVAAFAAVVLLAGPAAAEPPSTPAPAPLPANDCGYIRCAAQITLVPTSWMQINDGPGYNPGDQQRTEWFYVDSPDDLSFSQGKLILTNKLVPYFA